MGQRAITGALVLSLLTGIGGGRCLSLQQTVEGPSVIFETSFESGLEGWLTHAQAEYAVDDTVARTGRRSARITVPAGVELQYQQLVHLWRPVARGDELRVTAWVKSQGVTDGSGAYMALQFLDEHDQRVGIVHSQIGLATGAAGWEELFIEGKAPRGTVGARVDLILHAHGTAWFDDVRIVQTGRLEPWPELGDAERRITIRREKVVHPDFGGVGFHVFHHVHPLTQKMLDEVVVKRWRELNPSFARMNDSWEWDREMLDRVAEHILRFKATRTSIDLTTWDPKDTQPGEERRAYAQRVVDNLEYLVRDKGCTNIRWYCMTNELSLNQWGNLINDLPKFKDYHQCLYDELRSRGLDIGLLATDASPLERWHSIEWATQNMDEITAIYGGHHYLNDDPLDDERFYPWFLDKLRWGVGLARAKGKNFILGEFGCKQDGRTIDGIKRDVCIYWDTPEEPMVGIQLCEAALAAINAGVYAMGNWTFMDFPDDYNPHYINKWGLFKWSGNDFSTRAHYYAYGLLTKYFRGPATVYEVECNDPYLRVCALQNNLTQSWSIAVVSRYPKDVQCVIALDDVNGRFRKYVYDPQNVPQNPFGDLQGPESTLQLHEGRLKDTLRAGTLTVYTTAYHDQRPSPVRHVRVERTAEDQTRVKWDPLPEPDICYYRVYAAEAPDFVPSLATQLVSTVATEYVDNTSVGKRYYKVLAVDQSGNTSPVD
ncbi:MAG: hypothetical protein ACUVX8_10670 [Candidatus Zipacnadales bacterium]